MKISLKSTALSTKLRIHRIVCRKGGGEEALWYDTKPNLEIYEECSNSSLL